LRSGAERRVFRTEPRRSLPKRPVYRDEELGSRPEHLRRRAPNERYGWEMHLFAPERCRYATTKHVSPSERRRFAREIVVTRRHETRSSAEH
jgi:hypothetical protein